MRMSEDGLVALARHEGIVPGPYLCDADVWTFGIGHTAAARGPDPARMPRGMPADLSGAITKAAALFAADVRTYEAAVMSAVRVPLYQHELDALVSFHFNTGAIFRADAVRLLNAGDRRGAADALMNWRKPASVVPRREAERRLFRDGTYPAGKIPVWGVTPSGRVVWKPVRMVAPDDFLALLHPAAPKASPRPSPRPTRPWSLARLGALFRNRA